MDLAKAYRGFFYENHADEDDSSIAKKKQKKEAKLSASNSRGTEFCHNHVNRNEKIDDSFIEMNLKLYE